LKYIECTHCGKRYAANDKIEATAGKFVRCKNCLEKFVVVVHQAKNGKNTAESLDATDGWDPALTTEPKAEVAVEEVIEEKSEHAHVEEKHLILEDPDEESGEIAWDPTQTMPNMEAETGYAKGEGLSEEETQAKAAATLKAIQDAKKKKLITIGVSVALAALLAMTLYMALQGEQEVVQHQTPVVKRLSPQELDTQNPECRIAAARQWLLDYKAMHERYDAKAFMMMLKQTENRTADVKAVCRNPYLLKDILDAATKGERPEWFASEIQAISRK